MTRPDKVAFLEVQGVEDIGGRPTAVVTRRQVRCIDAIAQEEGVPQFLRP